MIDIEDDWRAVLTLPERDAYGVDATRLFSSRGQSNAVRYQ